MPRALPDFDGLLRWGPLQDWVAGQPGIPGSGPVTAVSELGGGSQNNIFLLSRDGARVVLRRPPRHLRPTSNETILREARALGALAGTDVPHPRLHALCADTSVIGTCFYVMAAVDGFTPIGPLPGAYPREPEWRRRLAFGFVESIARLAAVDHRAVGLGDFGKPDGWLERQVGRWRSQLEGYAALDGYERPEIPGVDAVGDWLERNRPRSGEIGIIHGDYHFANVMFAHNRPTMTAIVDWELSTLGDPLLDLATVLVTWMEPGDPPREHPPLEPWEDMPARSELIARYGELTGRDTGVVPWYFVLACYKLGIILEGTYARAAAGLASRETGDRLHERTLRLFALARQAIGAS